MKQQPLTLVTDRKTVVLRELITPADDVAYFEAVQESPSHVDNYLNEVASKYDSLEKVRDRRLNTGDDIRMGIWDGNNFTGSIRAHIEEGNLTQAEIGYWLRESATGHGYTRLAIRALTKYIQPKFSRVFAEVHPDNAPSIKALIGSEYSQVDTVERQWSGETVKALVFEPVLIPAEHSL